MEQTLIKLLGSTYIELPPRRRGASHIHLTAELGRAIRRKENVRQDTSNIMLCSKKDPFRYTAVLIAPTCRRPAYERDRLYQIQGHQDHHRLYQIQDHLDRRPLYENRDR
jgi:hypothetical protein